MWLASLEDNTRCIKKSNHNNTVWGSTEPPTKHREALASRNTEKRWLLGTPRIAFH